MSEQSLELLERIRRRLHHAARRITLADLLFGVVLTLGISSALWLLSTAIEAGFWLDTDARTVLFWFVAAATGSLAVYSLLLPLLRLAGILPGPAPDRVAHAIGERFPEVGDRLVNLLDLSEGRRSEAPDELVDGAVQMLGRDVDPVSFDAVADFSRARHAVRVAIIPLVSLLLFLAAAPGTFFHASQRLLHPGTHFEQPAPFHLQVEPGTVEIPRGTALEISVRAEGSEVPQAIELALNNVDEDHVETVRLTADSTGAFRHKLANVRRSFRYRVSAAPVTSRWFEATVTEHPLVRSLQVMLHFPGYSGVPPQRLDPNVGDVTGLPGTRVNLDAALRGSDVASASVQFDDGSSVPLEIEGDRATGSFTLSREGSYQIVLENARSFTNRDPIEYAMNLVVDAAPSVVIVRPESDAVLNEDLRSVVETRISDDYGFHDLSLFYRLAESRFGQTSETFEHVELPLSDPRRLDQDVLYDWRIGESTPLDPVPGDVIEYYVRVRDNDAFAGFKASETPLQRLRLPSLAEQYEQLDQEQDATESQMEHMLDQARQLDEQFSELRDEVRRKQDADWEDKRQLEQIQERQRQLEEQADELARQVESMNRSAQQNDLLSRETLEMYQEMQNVIEEINSPELREALQQLQQAIENLDLPQMQQAIEHFEFNEEAYRQRLERTLELFKNLRAQQTLEEAARRAEELAQQQERLAKETGELMEENAETDVPESEERAGEEDARAGEEDPRAGERDDGESSDEHRQDDASVDEQNASGQDGDEDEAQSDSNTAEDESTAQDPSEQRPSQENSAEQNAPSPAERRNVQQKAAEEQLARQQELSREEMQQLEELLREAQQQLEELKRGPAGEMQGLNQSLQQQQMPQQMQQNAEQLRRQQFQEAQSGQQQMQQQLQQLQQQLSQMQSSMQGSQMQVNMAGLRRALSDVLTLSQQQESLRRQLRTNVSEAPSLREDARQQVELSEGLSTVIDSLQALGKNIPQMSREVQRLSGQALREMGAATDAMTERAAGEAAGYQTAAMMNLNELALLLSEVLNQLMNQAGAGAGLGNMQQMIQQLQQMAQQQQQLNQQIQQFLNDIQGNRLSVDMQERLQQMSAQQQAIKRQLDELRRNPEARGNLLGDLDRIAEEMEQTIEELQRRQVEPRTIERQRRILQRLLDAQRSINERGRERRREAQEGEDVIRESPADLPPEEAAERLRRDLIRALESGYAPDYEELIKRYFELLQQQTVDQE